MLTAEQLRASIDLYTGECAFPLTLASLPGRNGLEVSLTARYAGNVRRQAATWNLDAPTGVLGLGWSLSLDAVVALREGTAVDPAAGYALVSPSGTTRLFRTGTADDGTHLYGAEAYEFWQVRHDPARQTWTVVRDDGDVGIYGDPSSGAGAVEWDVAWGGWADASARVSGQTSVATAWRLARVTNRWGDGVRYTYTQQTVQVGPPTASGARVAYTRACYLSRIDGVAGDALVLDYAEKQAFESPEPHTNPAAPNAWHDRWETRFLQTVTVLAADGTTLRTVTLGYGDGQGGTAFVGATDALKKRLLTSVHSAAAGGEALPGVRFSYYGQPVVTQRGRPEPWRR